VFKGWFKKLKAAVKIVTKEVSYIVAYTLNEFLSLLLKRIWYTKDQSCIIMFIHQVTIVPSMCC
jgi:hypothetical protein